ncbi:Negative regulator of mitotic exit [Zalaria obscura]|uniref:Negative regulator of mitotic exit n=1 Tax=Zalaria obscura TaxID=2024903 RepID=A0ACC3S9V2_9PEZI
MSFLFKSSKKQQANALPAVTRNIRSADGPGSGSQIPTLNGVVSPTRDGRPTHSPVAGSSVNNSLNSLGEKVSMRSLEDNGQWAAEKASATPSPEQKSLRNRSESEPRDNRMVMAPSRQPHDTSPYPWSQRRVEFGSSGQYPFPRYGAATNSVSSKDGAIYIMGGLINGSTVKGDLWMVESAHGVPTCFPVATTSEGPGPRVGHASLLVGNAFIVFGGDTKTEESDMLDDTLYLLNTSTKQWSRAAPAGPRPPGRYGHSLNILGSKIYIFGGQVEGFFFNDLVAFDLNALQQASNRWEILIQNTIDGGPPHGQIPPARTNHSMVTWNDKLYLFGGTDGVQWFNDVWSYDPRTNSWTQLECIGYIPAAREGHASALVGDVMYIFGGRTEEGNDLGDLAAFRISSRRWYTFQNMGPSPSPRSGHSMTTFGKHIVVLGGEPSSSGRDVAELSLAYFLDTSKIRYPADSQSQTPVEQRIKGHRLPSGDKSGIPQARGLVPREPMDPVMEGSRRMGRDSSIPMQNGSRLPRTPGMASPPPGMAPPSSGLVSPPNGMISPPPGQQPRMNGHPANRQPMRPERALSPTTEMTGPAPVDIRGVISPPPAEAPISQNRNKTASPTFSNDQSYFETEQDSSPQTYRPIDQSFAVRESTEQERATTTSRSSSRAQRQHKTQQSVDRFEETPRPSTSNDRPSMDRPGSAARRIESRQDRERELPVDSGLGSSPALSQQNDEISKELEAERQKNAWYASELALARKAGYSPSSNQSMDEKAADSLGDEDRPLLEALLKMRTELAKMQSSIEVQASSAAARIAEVERQRDTAVNEAVFAKARLAARTGDAFQGGAREPTPESDRVSDINRRLALSLAAQNELSRKIDSLIKEKEAEQQARLLAEDTADAAQKRVTELDMDRQRNASEIETLRSELHEAQKTAREEAANAAEAVASHKLLSVDKTELSSKLERTLAESQNHSAILTSLREAVTASTDKSDMLERKLEEERGERETLEQKLSQLRSKHEERTTELESTTKRLRDAEELAEKHASEARTHRQAVLDGLGKITERDTDDFDASDERVTILQQQVEAANAMVRQNQAAADSASEKLRRAEERIAGLEAYQEQASREGLSIRKQLQSTLRDLKSLHQEKAELQQQVQSQQLETNAIAVQHGALKEILNERGINASDKRRSRGLDSPLSMTSTGRFGTPDMQRMRDLEQQLETALKSHEDLKSQMDEVQEREGATRKEYEEKLTALDNDHQAAVNYLHGTEKMLAKMRKELQRVKSQAAEYLKELERLKDTSSKSGEAPTGWTQDRDNLQNQLETLQKELTASKSALETKITDLQAEITNRDSDLEALRSSHRHTQADLSELQTTHTQSRAELERLERDNSVLEARATDAEKKVQLLLDQVESSVDNYRRQSQQGLAPGPNGLGHRRVPSNLSTVSSSTAGIGSGIGPGHARAHSLGGDSVYSAGGSGSDTGVAPSEADPLDGRNSLALDSLANELDALRSHWETTNKQNYRLSDRSDFDRGAGLANWRRQMSTEDGEEEVEERPGTGGTVKEGVVGGGKEGAVV